MACVGVLQGNVQTARDLFRMGIKASPSFGALWQAYGVLEFHEQRLDTARSLFEEGLKRDPMHVMLFQVRGPLAQPGLEPGCNEVSYCIVTRKGVGY